MIRIFRNPHHRRRTLSARHPTRFIGCRFHLSMLSRRERKTFSGHIEVEGLIGLAMLIGSSLVCMTHGRTARRGGADGASSDGLAHGVCVADVADVAGGGVIVVMALPARVRANPASGTRPSSAGSSWSHTCTSNVRTMRSPPCRSSCSPPRRRGASADSSRADASTRPEMDQNPE